jgi:hypothetical protein
MTNNRTVQIPSEEQFLEALDVINLLESTHWARHEALPIIRREIKSLHREKASSFDVFSTEELIDIFSDMGLPSSQGQVVVMNEIVSRLVNFESFIRVFSRNCDEGFLSVVWTWEHERIFLRGWLSYCHAIGDVQVVWRYVANDRLSRYAQFLILKRAAELIRGKKEEGAA